MLGERSLEKKEGQGEGLPRGKREEKVPREELSPKPG